MNFRIESIDIFRQAGVFGNKEKYFSDFVVMHTNLVLGGEDVVIQKAFPYRGGESLKEDFPDVPINLILTEEQTWGNNE